MSRTQRGPNDRLVENYGNLIVVDIVAPAQEAESPDLDPERAKDPKEENSTADVAEEIEDV